MVDLLLHMCYYADFGRFKSNGVGISKVAPAVPEVGERWGPRQWNGGCLTQYKYAPPNIGDHAEFRRYW